MRPQEIVERALQRSGSSDCCVIVEGSSSANLRWAANSLTTNGVMRATEVTVIAIDRRAEGAAVGVVSRSVGDRHDVDVLVDLADAAARDASPAPDAAALVAAVHSSDWEDAAEETSAAVFGDLAPELGDLFAASRDAGHELFGFAEHQLSSTFLGTSSGARLRHVQPTGQLEVTGKSHRRSRSTWFGQSTRTFRDVDLDTVHRHVGQRLGWADRTIDLEPGRYDVILPPSAMADLMVYLYWSAGARDADEGRTVFSRPGGGTRVGDRVSDRDLRLWSDPKAPGVECAPFVINGSTTSMSSVFDNGLPLTATEWVSGGTLTSLLQSRHSAALTDLPFTPAVDNLALAVADSAGGLDDLVAGCERGLLLTTLWYIREVDPQSLLLTGLTRDGVYLVEDGEVTAAVNNFRFNESPVDLLGRVAASSRTELTLPREWADYFTRVAMPALQIADFNMSTRSQAS